MKHYRSIFISDVHLGMPASRADSLLNFLEQHHADTIYLVGDIFDFWALNSKAYWTPVYTNLIELITVRIRSGTRVIYLPGNHDAFLRYCQGFILGIEIVDQKIHTTATGEKFVVLHGDQYDYISRKAHWLALIGDRAYDIALGINTWLAKWRKRKGYPYWSFSQWAKASVKHAVTFIEGFEQLLAYVAKNQGASGVICGHIHTATIKQNDGFTYINCGDWVESCTAIVETKQGKFKIVTWTV